MLTPTVLCDVICKCPLMKVGWESSIVLCSIICITFKQAKRGTVFNLSKYSEDLKSDHLNSGNIRNQNLLKIKFQMFWFSKVWAVAMVPTIQNPDILVQISNGFWLNWGHMLGFKWLGFWISNPIQNRDHLQTEILFDILKSRLVWISDPHSTI